MTVGAGACYDLPGMGLPAKKDEVRRIFERVQARLEAEPWFARERWIAASHGFPRKAPEGITFHVFKRHWYNADGLGIHIESYLAFDERKRRKSYVTIHVLHHDRIPGTDRKRSEISKPFVDSVIAEVESWEGYRARAGKYGMQPFAKVLDGRDPAFPDLLAEEVSRLCLRLGPAMDRAIARANGE